MQIQDLLKELRDNDISVSLDRDDLKVRFNSPSLPPELLRKIKENKPEIIGYLRKAWTEPNADIPRGGLVPADERPYYPVSFSQYRLWVLSQMEEGSIAYNMPGMYVFEGEIDLYALNYAFEMLIKRHEILRTVFRENEEGTVCQFIRPSVEMPFEVSFTDLRSDPGKEEAVQRLAQKVFRKAFDLATGPLFRAGLLRVEDGKWVFLYVMHHIIGDGWSIGVLMKELLLLYNTRCRGENNPLPPLRIQYKDYVIWRQTQLSGKSLLYHKSYWLKQFEGELPVLDLPGDRPRPPVKTYNGASVNRLIDTSVCNRIKQIAGEQGATLFMSLMAVLNALLYRYTGQEDIIIGTSVLGREHPELENQIGFYVNTLALRTRFNGKDSYMELLKKAKQVAMEAYEHQVYPFYDLLDELRIRRDMSRNPIFDVMMLLQNTEISRRHEGLEQKNSGIKGYEGGKAYYSKFDLTLDFAEMNGHLNMGVIYNRDIFDHDTIDQFAGHFQRLLGAVIRQPALPIQELDYSGPEDKQKKLMECNNARIGNSHDRSILSIYEKFEKTSNSQAHTTELNNRANQLANYLKTRHRAGRGDVIGVRLHDTAWTRSALLGILKTGAACLPFHRQHSPRQVEYIVQDSRCKLIIDEEELARFRQEEERYSKDNPFPAALSSDDPLPANPEGDLSFIIYTSDTSKNPKGVRVNNNSLLNRIAWRLGDDETPHGPNSTHNLEIVSEGSLERLYFEVIEYIRRSSGSNEEKSRRFNATISDDF